MLIYKWVEQQSSSRSSIGPNWSRQPLGGVKKAEVKYPGYTSPLPLLTLLTSPRALECSVLLELSLSLRKNELSLQPCALDHT